MAGPSNVVFVVAVVKIAIIAAVDVLEVVGAVIVVSVKRLAITFALVVGINVAVISAEV